MDFDARIYRDSDTGLIVDLTDAPPISDAGIPNALAAMAALEQGSIANPDEGRRVGHYWLRDPALAPEETIAEQITHAHNAIERLTRGTHTDLIWIGIGGSGLGPRLLLDCLATQDCPLRVHFLDNTDPEGILRTLAQINPATTLVTVVSKSGNTIETRNGLLAAEQRYAQAGEPFEPHAIAITCVGSRLWDGAEKWQARIPIWNWVGGRTSITSPVGLVLMKLCDLDLVEFLNGAKETDVLTRRPFRENPAALLAAAWHAAGGGVGDRALVMEPYRDRFQLLAQYLQQLVMESLGKKTDRAGLIVHQGLTVYGNRGSTDQHAFIQQLRDGRDDAFVHFVETRSSSPTLMGEDGALTGDHLLGFFCGTRRALHEAGRPTITIQVPDTDARSLGCLVALFERAVGLYAELININAYHQPGVEAGKVAAKETLLLLDRITKSLSTTPCTAAELADNLNADPRLCWRLLHQLANTHRAQVDPGPSPARDKFWLKQDGSS